MVILLLILDSRLRSVCYSFVLVDVRVETKHNIHHMCTVTVCTKLKISQEVVWYIYIYIYIHIYIHI